jgi:hypothetical protein
MNDQRGAVLDLVRAVAPADQLERTHQGVILDWLRGNRPIYRTTPDVPDPHLVSYFVLMDRTSRDLLLVATPTDEFGRQPLFLTVTRTRGARPHTDVSLWFVLTADKDAVTWFDKSEFSGIRWLALPELRAEPIEHLDPHMHRFIGKLDRTVG